MTSLATKGGEVTDQLKFEQRSDGLWVTEDELWVARLDGGASYRIVMRQEGWARPDYELTFVVRQRTLQGVLLPRYERVSTHHSFERAAERGNRHHRNRAKLADAS